MVFLGVSGAVYDGSGESANFFTKVDVSLDVSSVSEKYRVVFLRWFRGHLIFKDLHLTGAGRVLSV